MSRSDKNNRFMAMAARYTSIAMALPATIFAGYALGSGLDLWLGTTYLKIACLILGIIGGFIQLIRLIMRDMQEK